MACREGIGLALFFFLSRYIYVLIRTTHTLDIIRKLLKEFANSTGFLFSSSIFLGNGNDNEDISLPCYERGKGIGGGLFFLLVAQAKGRRRWKRVREWSWVFFSYMKVCYPVAESYLDEIERKSLALEIKKKGKFYKRNQDDTLKFFILLENFIHFFLPHSHNTKFSFHFIIRFLLIVLYL